MKILQGTGASQGVALGRIKIIKSKNTNVTKHTIENVASEIARFNSAVEKTKETLGVLYEKTVREASEAEAEIFSIHIMMLEDGSLTDCCESIIYEQSVNAEYAVSEAAKVVCAMLVDTNDDYMMARTADVEDIKNGILTSLTGENEDVILDENTIIFAHDLTPSQTINLDKSKILAFVTEKGSKNSHTAILARSMKIPSIVGVTGCMRAEFDGLECGVDAEEAAVFIQPDEKTKSKILVRGEVQKSREEKLRTLKGKKSITKSGKEIKLYANIGGEDDLDKVIENDAEGIGLFRSEFLYLGRTELPDEETQFCAYKKVLEKMQGKETVIRTMDIGADKQAACLELEQEENPALGYRAIRICLEDNDIFKTQLRALYRASVFGNLSIMFPMITSKDEVERVMEVASCVRQELKDEGISIDENVRLGIMIETPAAALISDELAPLVDFFSIGTNDLIQYTLAADRQNDKIGNIYNPRHPAVMKLIKMTCDNAHRAGIWVGVCGELAADTDITQTLVAFGVDELSVSSGYVLAVRESIINSN
ncbi:MAG: phosphoenolpyruvate--protein phosphotransferase [Clostridia bacterium]|nr:phosphoenolpyruvate--protein phosphotransferase [Clostridia bacterium]